VASTTDRAPGINKHIHRFIFICPFAYLVLIYFLILFVLDWVVLFLIFLCYVGANDNGSGTGALLQIAKLIYSNKVSFDYTVVFITFSGEEQGLYGSIYAAQQV
jgi:Peptidase family M28